MPYRAEVYKIFIASPSDVAEERNVITKVIQEWNDINSEDRQVVLLPLRWETHSSPTYGKRPQSIINKQVVDNCDLLIGIFWTRIGSPTGISDSGTIEEITRVSNDGKPVMLYFSKAKASPDDLDLEQLDKLRKFKKQTLSNALIENYDSIIEFRDKLTRQMEIQIKTLMSNINSTNNDNSIPNKISLGFDNGLGQIVDSQNVTTKLIYVKNRDSIPDYIQESDINYMYWGQENDKDLYRKQVDNIIKLNKTHFIIFSLKNEGVIGARDIYISFNVKSDEPSLVFTKSKLNHIQGILQISSDKDEDFNCIELNALQPKRIVHCNEKFELRTDKNCSVEIEATIYADILPEPIIKKLTVNITVSHNEFNYQQLLNTKNTKNA
ncbi:DUF4062 domain-containing protein [Morganella morganii subsp. morganii]|uniref:DUF4062 domain-containing protein n=1 Tax=Morganella morganii TaxID=582 RepID=UPI001BDA53A2|nr:DUF4062 domain-containing protein [Morganella morganii]MBT0366351.1 DUF4062 domain-containing protein [Morganella morganii subsp. morganii]